jgi:hypothetical protein
MNKQIENQNEQDNDFPMDYTEEEAYLSKVATIMLHIIYGGAIGLAIIAIIIHHSK